MSTPTESRATLPSPTPPSSASRLGSFRQIRSTVNQLAKVLANSHQASTRDLAELRRLNYRQGHASIGPAFWRLVTRYVEPGDTPSPDLETDDIKRWMVILQGLATIRELHREKSRLGAALFAANVSEARLTRLLQARGDALFAQIRPVAHQLRSQAQPVDWSDVATLIFSDGHSRADQFRHWIASDYYGLLYKNTAEESANRNHS